MTACADDSNSGGVTMADQGGGRGSGGDLESWPFVGREDVLDRVAQLLNSSAHHGVALMGDLGIGKTATARRALERLDADVVNLRATSVVRKLPMGVLGPLLRNLPERPTDPVSALQILAHYYAERDDGRPVILAVDDAHQLDDVSAAIIAQLVISRQMKLLLTGRHNPAPHVELMELVTEDMLAVVELPPLGDVDVEEIIRRYLGDPVSQPVHSLLARAAAGNPFQLRNILTELTENGTIRRTDGVWVLSSPDFVYSPHSKSLELSLARLARTPVPVRAALELVSFIEPVGYEVLTRMVPGPVVDEAIRLEMLELSNDYAQQVGFSQPLFGDAFRQSTSASRRREIRDAVNSSLDRHSASVQRLTRFVELDLWCGVPVPIRDALQVAQHAADFYQPDLALRVLGHIRPDELSDPELRAQVQMMEAWAWRIKGDYVRALTIIEEVDPGVLDLEGYVELQVRTARVLYMGMGQVDAAAEMLTGTESAITGDPDAPAKPGSIQAATRVLRSERGHVLVAAGRFADAIPGLRDVFADESTPAGSRAVVATSLADAYLAIGKFSEALEVSAWLARTLREEPDFSFRVRAFIFERLFGTYTVVGDWDMLDHLFEQIYREAGRFVVYHGGGAKTAQASVHMSHGDLRAAYAAAREAIAASSAFDPDGMRVAALGIAAVATSILGEVEASKKYCAQVDATLARSTAGVHVNSFAELLLLSARVRNGARGASEELEGFAERMHKLGILHLEMEALGALGLMGDLKALEALSQLKGTHLLARGRVFTLVAEAMLSGDTGKLLRGAQLAEESQHWLMAAQVAAVGMRSLSSVGSLEDIQLRNRLRALYERADAQTGGVASASIPPMAGARRPGDPGRPADAGERGASGGVESLTPRELEMARLAAAGSSNKAIAERMGVSVRTVEGHLYRAYGKLFVDSREELAALFGSD